MRAGQRLAIRGLEVQVVGVSHDAREPTQFVLSDGQRRFGMLTDLGMATAEVLECYRAVDALVVEANHDSTMLAGGPYPYFLKARVGGSRGHLNNHQSAELVKQLDWGRMRHLVLAHLSERTTRRSWPGKPSSTPLGAIRAGCRWPISIQAWIGARSPRPYYP